MFLIRLFFWLGTRAQETLAKQRGLRPANAPSAKDALTRGWQAGAMAHSVTSFLFRQR